MTPTADTNNGLYSTQIDPVSARITRMLYPDGDPRRCWQAFRYGFVVFAIVWLFSLLIVRLPTYIWPALITTDSQLVSEFSDRIASIAGIAAGIAGILLAVVVFSVQLHAQRDDEGAFMTRYLARRHMVPWITGYSLGFALFNGYAVLMPVFGASCYWFGVAILDAVGLTILLAATYFLVCSSVNDATKKLSGNVFGVFHGEVGLYAAAG
jgi:hypothetical protein